MRILFFSIGAWEQNLCPKSSKQGQGATKENFKI